MRDDRVICLDVLSASILQVLNEPSHVRVALGDVGVGIACAPYEGVKEGNVILSLLMGWSQNIRNQPITGLFWSVRELAVGTDRRTHKISYGVVKIYIFTTP